MISTIAHSRHTLTKRTYTDEKGNLVIFGDIQKLYRYIVSTEENQ